MNNKKQVLVTEALGKLQKICSLQEKCAADIIVLLKRWGIEVQQHPGIIDKLKKDGFIDESRFATAFVRDKVRFDHWGFIKINYFLRQKGISRKVTEDACKAIDRDEYAAMIRKELGKKEKSLKGAPREIWGKLARYGSSRGYEMEIMHDFLSEIAPDE